jgi:squalene synthase HpnC
VEIVKPVASGRHDIRDLISKARQENFPVASRLLPRGCRRHLLAVYGFARFVDDIGDEAEPEERLGLLDAVESDLVRLYSGRTPRLPAILPLTHTVRDRGIPAEPFHLLVEAARHDQKVTRYESFDDLLHYCELSANPVGRIVLHVFGTATPERFELSDRVCTALQIIEHCQDVGEDYTRGRVYLPGEDLRRFGCDESEFARVTTAPSLRRVVALQAERATELLRAGGPLLASLPGFARIAVAGYIAGGQAVLAALSTADHDVLGRRVHPRRTRLLTAWLHLLIQSNSARAPWAGKSRRAPSWTGEDRRDPTSPSKRTPGVAPSRAGEDRRDPTSPSKRTPGAAPSRPGGDPTSIVQRPRAAEGTERDSVDNAERRAGEENRR